MRQEVGPLVVGDVEAEVVFAAWGRRDLIVDDALFCLSLLSERAAVWFSRYAEEQRGGPASPPAVAAGRLPPL